MTDCGRRPGDMFKSVYDPDDNGVVDSAQAIPTAFGTAYHLGLYNIVNDNEWTDIPLEDGHLNLHNVTHDTETNPERITVGLSGTYLILYHLHFFRLDVLQCFNARIYKNSDSELEGSFAQIHLPGMDFMSTTPTHQAIIAALEADDYITLQAAAKKDTGVDLETYFEAPFPPPDYAVTAIVNLHRIGD